MYIKLVSAWIALSTLAACGGGGGSSDDSNNTTVSNNPSSTISNRVILPGAECVAGGIQVDSGIDDNGNGILDPAEIDTSEIICDGVDGNDGVTGLVEQTAVPPGVFCTAGGVRYDVGKDANNNGALDAFEIDSSEFLCSS